MGENWTKVLNSTLISAYKYDSAEKELYVRFASNGSIYVYYDVYEDLAKEISVSISPGTLIYQKVIKAGKKYKKIK
jgi:hypothetical protein